MGSSSGAIVRAIRSATAATIQDDLRDPIIPLASAEALKHPEPTTALGVP